MSEILTESFCERCGTRYTFESAAPRGARLKGIKVISRGLKNFVMSDDTSMDEAMAAARSDTDREVTAHQLDAFHKTFNFCMSCRQYTCGNCWNEAENQCLSCAPHLGQDVLQAPFPDLEPSAGLLIGTNGSNGSGARHPQAAEPMAWPSSDLMREEAAPIADTEPVEAAPASTQLDHVAPVGEVTADADMPAIDDLVGDTDVEPIDMLARLEGLPVEPAADVVAPPTGEAAEPDARAEAAVEQTADLLRRFRPGQNLDDEIAAFERAQPGTTEEPPVVPAAELPEPVIASEPEPTVYEPEPIAAEPVAVAPEPEPVPAPAAQEPEPEPVAAAPEREPEPVAAAPEPEPRRDDLVEQPTWRIVAPDPSADVPAPRPPAPPSIPVEPVGASREPQWPAQPEWPAQRPAAEGLPFLGRPAAASGGVEALWAESAREVGAAPAAVARATGVQPCVSCGLSLSSTARFCRRCGTRQG